ncbi:MAG: hypothetical protein KJ709_04320 [Nanoarchaeota archaeon]|nr:hypothetical protein [Nanoarchaeota archaeon]
MRAQAALEFIMTYGFALMIVIIVIASLSYLGIVNYESLLPPKCAFPLDMACVEEPSITTDSVSFMLQNNAEYDIIIDPEQKPWSPQKDISGGYMTGMMIYSKRSDGTEVTCRPGQEHNEVTRLDGKPKKQEQCIIKRGDAFRVKLTPSEELPEDLRITTFTGFSYTSMRTKTSYATSGELSSRVN